MDADGRWTKRAVHSIWRARCAASATAFCSKKQVVQRVRSAQTRAALISMASQDERHIATVEQWDADAWTLNTPDGIVDLRTGKTRPITREDYCTKMTAVAPGGDCPLWRKFLSEITGNAKAFQSFLQRVCGYALTGSTEEHALFFLNGTGANGKSVFLSTVSGILGDYARTASMDTFMSSHNTVHPTDVASLQGARLVIANEVEEGRRWDEPKLKSLTGGDRIAARFMRQDFFQFVPQFKLAISGNHRPGLRSIDEAMRRRMNLVPFSVTIPPAKRDSRLAEKLRAEWGGILQWMIEGCLEWQRIGLAPPKAVILATQDYLESEDALGRWLEERTVKGKELKQNSTDLFIDWRRWTETRSEFTGTQRRFSQNLESRGFIPMKGRSGNYFVGLTLCPAITAATVREHGDDSAITNKKYQVQ